MEAKQKNDFLVQFQTQNRPSTTPFMLNQGDKVSSHNHTRSITPKNAFYDKKSSNMETQSPSAMNRIVS